MGLALEEGGLTSVCIDWADEAPRIEDLRFFKGSGKALSDELKTWVEDLMLTGAGCFAVTDPLKTTVLQVERPEVEEGELEDAVRWLVKDSIDFPIDDAVIDTFEYPQDAMRGRRKLVNVVAVRKSEISFLVDLISGSGLELQAIDVSELALRNITGQYAEEGRPIALLVLDESTGFIALFKDDLLYFSRQLAINTSVFTNSDDTESEQRGYEQLCLELQRSLDYFESQLNQAAPKRLLIYSTGATLKLQEVISERLNIDAAVLDLGRLGIEVGNRALSEQSRMSSVQAVGAALRQRLA